MNRIITKWISNQSQQQLKCKAAVYLCFRSTHLKKLQLKYEFINDAVKNLISLYIIISTIVLLNQ